MIQGTSQLHGVLHKILLNVLLCCAISAIFLEVLTPEDTFIPLHCAMLIRKSVRGHTLKINFRSVVMVKKVEVKKDAGLSSIDTMCKTAEKVIQWLITHRTLTELFYENKLKKLEKIEVVLEL